MPSPFPGMDPWLESPTFWPGLHDRLASEISAVLNYSLPEPYYADLGVREELGIISGPPEARSHRIVPDVGIQRPREGSDSPAAALAVLEKPRVDVGESLQIDSEPLKLNFVEIRDVNSDDEVVTLIEILSPSNKTRGDDREKYLRKRLDIFGSQTSLIEIDLLRESDRTIYGTAIEEWFREHTAPPEYVTLVNRAWKRSGTIAYEIFPMRLTEPLPVIRIPLRRDEPESTLDLQYAFQQAWDGGPYRRAVDYSKPPVPPLPEPLQNWADVCVERRSQASA